MGAGFSLQMRNRQQGRNRKWSQPLRLTPEQVKRYSRHIIMQDVGSAGQRKMMEASALIIGAGGLGSPSAVYLAPGRRGQVGHR